MLSKRKIAALMAEFLGTAVLAFTFLSVSRSGLGLIYFVGLACALSIMLMTIGLGRDLQLNPAYTIALATARRIKPVKAIGFLIFQILGAYAAYKLYEYLFGHFNPGQPIVGVSKAYDQHIMVAEAAGAFVFGLIAAGVMYQRSHPVVRAAVNGGAYAVALLVAVAAAGAQESVRFVNPAVALASQSWGWLTYVLGPIVGAIIGVNLYALLFASREQKAVAAVTADGAHSSADAKPLAGNSIKEKVAAAKEKAKAKAAKRK